MWGWLVLARTMQKIGLDGGRFTVVTTKGSKKKTLHLLKLFYTQLVPLTDYDCLIITSCSSARIRLCLTALTEHRLKFHGICWSQLCLPWTPNIYGCHDIIVLGGYDMVFQLPSTTIDQPERFIGVLGHKACSKALQLGQTLPSFCWFHGLNQKPSSWRALSLNAGQPLLTTAKIDLQLTKAKEACLSLSSTKV